jgi:hypothetical protein
MRGLGRVQVSISGLNFSGHSGGTRSITLINVVQPNANGVRNGFEGAKAADEQQAGSTAASCFAPAAARSGCLEHVRCIEPIRLLLLSKLIDVTAASCSAPEAAACVSACCSMISQQSIDPDADPSVAACCGYQPSEMERTM